MNNTNRTLELLDDWYEVGLKIYQGTGKFIADHVEGDPEGILRVCHKNGGQPECFKFATLGAFEGLKENAPLEEIVVGKGLSAMSGWQLTKEGRERMRTRDKNGKQISRLGRNTESSKFKIGPRSDRIDRRR